MENKKSLGILTISKKAILSLIAHIAVNCNGVTALADRSKRDELSRVIGKNTYKGVYLQRNGGMCKAEIFAVGRYGISAYEIANEISEKVKLALAGTGIEIEVVVNLTDIQR